jgi:beta-1,2-mannobiose phosphorylase / 1,2-beta-oligomannan phosphorylase
LSQLGLHRTRPLGVFRDNDSVALIGREKYATTYQLVLGNGRGSEFKLRSDKPSILLPPGRNEHLQYVSDVRISQVLEHKIMTYSVDVGGAKHLRIALPDPDGDTDAWEVPAVNDHLAGKGMVVPEFMHDAQYVLFFGERDLRVAFSRNLVSWHTSGRALASPRSGRFDSHAISLIATAHIEQGLLVLYETSETKRGQVTISMGLMLCSPTDPEVIMWRSDGPLYQYTAKAADAPAVLGAVFYEHEIVVYLTSARSKIFTIEFANPYAAPVRAKHHTRLHRFPENPILSPGALEWESQAVFNPAAFTDRGRVHLLYRAMGPDGISRLGYASSADGVHFDERLDYPVYQPKKGFGAPSSGREKDAAAHYDLEAHLSGGGWAGCEDPRAVTIDGRAYLSFVAFDGWEFVRQAITSISLEDLHAKRWRWRKPVLMSKPGEIQKNWVIFPERINGKFAILHGLSPNIHIEYLDSLAKLDGNSFIESLPQAGGWGYAGREGNWDNRVRGAGAPPIKTPLGWLLLYHATDQRDPGRYKLGAMILDHNDPTKILFRSAAPILEPDEWYENEGKPGVVYTCGAVIVDKNLVVYYGGGDKHIAVARANTQAFLDALAHEHTAKLEPVGSVA